MYGGVGSKLRLFDHDWLISGFDLLRWETEGIVDEWDNFNFTCLVRSYTFVIALSTFGWFGIVVEFFLVRLYAFNHLDLSECFKRRVWLLILPILFEQ